MDSNGSAKLKRKQQQHENESPQPGKNQSPKKITDMDEDCLEKIFDRLDLVSLFNMAIANEWLRPAARIVYKRQYGMKKVSIYSADVFLLTTEPYQGGHTIKLNGLKMCLQYLRCFGPSISRLIIWYEGWNNKQCEHIHHYVNKYCARSLNRLVFMMKPAGIPINQFEIPFVNIRTVEVHGGDLGIQLASFPHWFPNLSDLRLNNVLMDNKDIVMPFFHLKYLDIDMTHGNFYNGSMTKDAHQLLKSCYQLQHLKILMAGRRGVSMTQLLYLLKYQSIRNLIVSLDLFWKSVDLLEIQQLAANHPDLHELDLPNYKFTADAALTFIHQLGSLKKIRLGMVNASECDRFVSELNVIGQWQHSSYTDFQNHRLIILHR